MRKLQALKIALLIVILAEEIKKVSEKRKLPLGHFSLDTTAVQLMINDYLNELNSIK
ncbi:MULTISPECIES: hypothetical protein [Macrococcoides]|uniref:hypothetical protein n=1 Tax=Macrococcoides TaxID=3076173 RepID=UPI0012FEF113|nr:MULTISPECIES: hypothetical protein [Macrococcus]